MLKHGHNNWKGSVKENIKNAQNQPKTTLEGRCTKGSRPREDRDGDEDGDIKNNKHKERNEGKRRNRGIEAKDAEKQKKTMARDH